jgi:hypothetical protein
MYSLKSFQKMVQNLNPLKLWMFVLARGFMGFGVGVMAMQYFPHLFAYTGLPMVVVGFVLLGLSLKGSTQKSPPANKDNP